MPLLRWNEYDLIGCLEVEPVVDEDQVAHAFEVHQRGVVLRVTIRQYESVVQLALAREAGGRPLIELAVFVRGGVVAQDTGAVAWVELRDCVLAGSRFSYIEMGDVFDRRRYPHGHLVRVHVRPDIQVEVVRA